MMNKAKSAARLITGCCLLLAAAAPGGQHPRDLFQPVVISEEPAVLTELPVMYSPPLIPESGQSRTFTLQYADAADMLALLKQHHGEWFTDNKAPEADPLTNSLFIEA